MKHRHVWKRCKLAMNYVCTWGLSGTGIRGGCGDNAVWACKTCDEDARCSAHGPKKVKKGKDLNERPS